MGMERSPNLTDLSKLSFTDRFVKETMRFFPLALYIMRETDEDVDIGL